MPLYLTIATINCRGLRDPAKRLAFFAYARKLDVQVLCLQETHSQPRDEPKWQNEWDDKNQAVFYSNTENSRKSDAGTAILLNHPLLKFGTIRKDSEGRILAAEIRCNSFGFQVVGVYAFTASYPIQKRENFFNQLYNFFNVNSTIILLGDFNCVDNPTLDRCPPKNAISPESKQLAEILQLCKMFDSHTKLHSKKHTCFGENFSSRIDCIYATCDVSVVSTRVLPNQFSDHDTVIVQFDIHLQPSRGRGYWKNNVTCFQDNTFLQDFENKWQNWKKTKNNLGPVEWWIRVKNKIKKLVIDHSTRLRQESSAIKNNLKHQLDQLANSPNSNQTSNYIRKLKRN